MIFFPEKSLTIRSRADWTLFAPSSNFTRFVCAFWQASTKLSKLPRSLPVRAMVFGLFRQHPNQDGSDVWVELADPFVSPVASERDGEVTGNGVSPPFAFFVCSRSSRTALSCASIA
jgi:hypothetical protein